MRGGAGAAATATQQQQQQAQAQAQAQEEQREQLDEASRALRELTGARAIEVGLYTSEIARIENEVEGNGRAVNAALKWQFAIELEDKTKKAYAQGVTDGKHKSSKSLMSSRMQSAAARTSQERLKGLTKLLAEQVVVLQAQLRDLASHDKKASRYFERLDSVPASPEAGGGAGAMLTALDGLSSADREALGLDVRKIAASRFGLNAASSDAADDEHTTKERHALSTALDHAEVQSPSQRSVSVVKQTLHQLAEELNVHGMKLGVEDEDEPPVVVDDEARALAREGSLREQLRTLEADHAMVLAELDEMRAVVAAAGAAHASPIDDMRADELRELVRRLRHDAEVMRMKSAMEARELLTRSLRTLDTSLTKEVRWTSDRLIRHTEARDMALLKDLHLEVAGLKKAMHKNLRIAVHSLRGRLLPTQPTELLATKLQGDLRKDQVRWLQGCCGVLFPHCLVCIFDPSSQDDVEHSPWTILEAIDEAHAAPLALQAATKRPGMLPSRVQ